MNLVTESCTALTKALPACHLVVYSSLLGTELYQSFVMTKVCYIALPRSAFRTLQKRVFPVYFRAQVALVLLSAATFPPAGIFGLAINRADWIPHLVAAVTAVLNLGVYEPQTRQCMIGVAHQETRDAANSSGGTKDESTPDMDRAKRGFSRAHAMCIHLNLISIGAMLFYGLRLASRL